MDKSLRNQLIFAFYIPSTLIAIAYALLSPVLPVYASTLSNSYLIIGVILAAEAFGRVVGDLPSSWFMRRFGVKNAMIGSIIVTLVPFFLLYFVTTTWLTITLLFVSGLGHAVYNISRHTYIAVIVRSQMRGRAIGLLGGMFRVGSFIGPLLGGWVAERYGLNSAFLVFVLFALMTMVFVWRFMPGVKSNAEAPHKDASYSAVVRDNGYIFLTAGTGQIMAQLTRKGWNILVPLYGSQVLGLSVETIGIVMGIGAGVDALFFLLSGVIMDRFGRKWAIVPSFILQGIGVALLPLMPSATALTLLAAFIGFSNSLSSGTMMTVGADFAPPHARGEFLGMWRLIGDMGFMAAPLIVGAVAQAVVLGGSIAAVSATGFTAAVIFSRFVPETLKRR